MAATAGGLYSDNARSLFGMNTSATSTTSPMAVLESLGGNIARLAKEIIDSRRSNDKLLGKQISLLASIAKKDEGLSVSDLLVARYLSRFLGGAAGAASVAAAGIGGLASRGAKTIMGSARMMFGNVTSVVMGGLKTMMTAAAAGIAAAGRPIMRTISALSTGFGSIGFGAVGKNLLALAPKAIGIMGKIASKFLWPITALMGAFDAFNGFTNADELLGRDGVGIIGKLGAGLSSAVNGLLLGVPDWLAEKLNFKNFAQMMDTAGTAAYAAISSALTSITTSITDGVTGLMDGISSGISNLGSKLRELGKWTWDALSYAPGLPDEIQQGNRLARRPAPATPANPVAPLAPYKPTESGSPFLGSVAPPVSSADTARELNKAAALTTIGRMATTGTIAVTETSKTIVKEAAEAIEDTAQGVLKKSADALSKVFSADTAEAIAQATKSLAGISADLLKDKIKKYADIAPALNSYLGIGGAAGLNTNYIGAGSGGNGGMGLPSSRTGLRTTGATGGAGGTLGGLVAGAESAGSYNAYNKGTANGKIIGADKPVDLENMPISEIMRRQSLPAGDPDRLFAVGKYQVIPSTMQEAVSKLGLDTSKPLNKDMQERIFRDYLVGDKRPEIRDFITGKTDNRDNAVEGLSKEFASFAGIDGRGKYGSGNKVSVSPQQSAAALDAMRTKYAEGIKQGLSPQEAYARAFDASGVKNMMPGNTPNITMNNQNAIRNLDLKPELKNQLEYAATQSGVKVEVTSGGQAAIGTGGPRTGSTRHDDGGAADLKLYRVDENGKRQYLDMNNPADAAIMQRFTTDAVKAGATGVGAGYMGGKTLHIGGGSTAAWGGAPWISGALAAGMEGRKGFNLNDWINSRKSDPSTVTQSTQSYADKMKEAGFTQKSMFGPARPGPTGAGLEGMPNPTMPSSNGIKNFVPGFDGRYDEMGQAIGKAIVDGVNSQPPKTPEFVPTQTNPMAPDTPLARGSAVSKNPTGAVTEPTKTDGPDITRVPMIDEYTMLMTNSSMMA